jgi:hypothetical protein
LNNTPRNGGENICMSALTAASIIVPILSSDRAPLA